ncbi:hypothetical protein TB2_038135 [Malus domestica]
MWHLAVFCSLFVKSIVSIFPQVIYKMEISKNVISVTKVALSLAAWSRVKSKYMEFVFVKYPLMNDVVELITQVLSLSGNEKC